MSRPIRAIALLVATMAGVGPSTARADSDFKFAGFATGLTGPLTLPLASGAPPVTVSLSLGIPAVTISFNVTPDTEIEAHQPLPVTLVNGDRIEVTAVVDTGALVATKLGLTEFPELELLGVAGSLPTGGVTLPIAPGTTLDFTLDLGIGGTPLPVRLTGDTHGEGDGGGGEMDDQEFTLMNGDTVRIEAIVRDQLIVITDISRP